LKNFPTPQRKEKLLKADHKQITRYFARQHCILRNFHSLGAKKLTRKLAPCFLSVEVHVVKIDVEILPLILKQGNGIK